MTDLDWKYWADLVHCGQRERALRGRKVVYHLAPDVFHNLDFNDDQPFLDPLLVAAAREPDPAQAIASVLTPYLRLRLNDALHSPSVGEESGCPRSGSAEGPYVRNPKRREEVPAVADIFSLALDEIPVFKRVHPLMQRYTPEADQHIVETLICDDSLIRTLSKTLSLVKTLSPEFSALLTETVRGFALLSSTNILSFATEDLHGLVFLSLPSSPTVAYFLEDVVHQCGHVVFGSMFYDARPWGDTPISKFTGDQHDRRTAYVVFHGVFTECVIARTLLTGIERHALAATEEFEARGRLAFVLCKYRLDLASLFALPLADTEDWHRMRTEMKEVFVDLVGRAGSIIEGLDVSGHGYSFDLQTFCQRNGRPDSVLTLSRQDTAQVLWFQ